MLTRASVEINAPAAEVWDIFSDVEHWHEWTKSVTRLDGLDGPQIAIGNRYAIKQPRLPKLVWTVTEVTPGTSWTWEQRSPGGRTVARHEVVALSAGRTLVRQELEQAGPIGSVVARLMLRTTKRYLDLEGEGLKDRAENARNHSGPAS
ncbi:MAG: hypothetical protein QOH57_3546 [Mycobacterium sp.]|jgi:uncharacterized membrane protein|nr:hypothetical protein [Mycobacterium sp.]